MRKPRGVIRANSDRISKHYGYVDDCLTLLIGRFDQAVAFTQQLDHALEPLKWEHDINSVSQHFLDVHISTNVERVGGFGETLVSFDTNMYRKPNFKPHYLASLSNHPLKHKIGIHSCEAVRALLCCSKKSMFEGCMHDICKFLEMVGYPKPPQINYDACRRGRLLDKLAVRSVGGRADQAARTHRSTVYLVLQYQSQLKSLGACTSFEGCIGSVFPVRIKLAWSMRPNSMRKLYSLNWPRLSLEV